MATTYQQLMHSAALKLNALIGSQAATLSTTYATAVLSQSNWKSADFPYASAVDAILQSEQDFVSAVAFTGQHPFRQNIIGLSSAITSGSTVPKTEVLTSKAAIGIPGAIRDSSDFTALVEMPMDVVTRRIRNANSHYVTPVYYYKIDGGYIYHTRTSVIFELCTYDRATQVAAFAANGNMLLPDACESGIVARALSLLFRDGAYTEQAAVWRQYSDEALAAIRGGSTNVVPRSVPVPVTQEKAG